MKKLLTSIMLMFCLSVKVLGQNSLIINHNHTDFSKIPNQWITQAKNIFRIGYGHTSHGSQIVTGMDAIKTVFNDFNYAKSTSGLSVGIFFNDYWGNSGGAADLGSGGYLGWRDATIQMLNLSNNDRNVVMWSWCGGVSSTNESGINTYLNAMSELETQYPNVKFIYMTGHLDGSGQNGNLNQRNEQIRSYCITNNKILFDFADIESYDPNAATNFMLLLANDGCDYDSNNDGNLDRNWADDWVTNNPSGNFSQCVTSCGGCAHSERLNCVLKGGAFWWLLAKLAGWEDELPIELGLFTATCSANGVVLDWRTETELNNFGFDIERKIFATTSNHLNGEIIEDWQKIYFVSGNGTTNSPKIYKYTDSKSSNGKYVYRLKQINNDGTYNYSSEVEVLISNLPCDYYLDNNFPNPFNPATTIQYALPNESNVEIIIYDIIGNEIRSFLIGSQNADYQKIVWDGKNNFGNEVSSGIYLVHFSAQSLQDKKVYEKSSKMILLK